MDPTSGMRIFNRNMIKEFASNINYGPEPDTISFCNREQKDWRSTGENGRENCRRELSEFYKINLVYDENANFNYCIAEF